ncbi:MAG: pyridoxamine kinase [Clostridia bacterium]|nr:pyridoxamine kinase [Clostridia bacterium]
MQHQPPKRIAAIHDLSCVGRCALTVVIPVLSVMGYQTVPLPTALLSSHTGGFDDLYFKDLTEHISPIAQHFLRLDLRFRAIYTGFLGSAEQIHTVESFIREFRDKPDETGEAPLILIDPVMGDDGVLYSTYTPDLVEGIRHLSRYAQVLTPNLTEACLLTGIAYEKTQSMSETALTAYLETLLSALEAKGTERIVITGVETPDGKVANYGRDRDGKRFFIAREHMGNSYPGTGEIFASVLLGELLRGSSFEAASAAAADYVGFLICQSSKIDTPTRMGVALEPYLHLLAGKQE